MPVISITCVTFAAKFGLGNVRQQTGDCWNENYENAPSDGSVSTTGDCSEHVVRGESWGGIPRNVRAGFRFWLDTGFRFDLSGFRVARTP